MTEDEYFKTIIDAYSTDLAENDHDPDLSKLEILGLRCFFDFMVEHGFIPMPAAPLAAVQTTADLNHHGMAEIAGIAGEGRGMTTKTKVIEVQDALYLANVLIKYHMKPEVCIFSRGDVHSALEIHNRLCSAFEVMQHEKLLLDRIQQGEEWITGIHDDIAKGN